MKPKPIYFFLAAAAAFAAYFVNKSVELPEPSPVAQPTPNGDGKVTQAEYGERWPFTVPEGIIDCVSRADVVLRVGEDVYAINGTARGKAKPGGEYKDLAQIWRDQTADVGGKVGIPGELMEKGLKICEAKAGT
ncbi:YebY family protein [Trichocoleus sp. Lan]|uniref:DUF2511 domain-containing protein n=1 Tax=Trichocoleus sp. Lan TaxID=2933927 RepID=UPI003299EB9B